jgi:hypothetical protein
VNDADAAANDGGPTTAAAIPTAPTGTDNSALDRTLFMTGVSFLAGTKPAPSSARFCDADGRPVRAITLVGPPKPAAVTDLRDAGGLRRGGASFTCDGGRRATPIGWLGNGASHRRLRAHVGTRRSVDGARWLVGDGVEGGLAQGAEVQGGGEMLTQEVGPQRALPPPMNQSDRHAISARVQRTAERGCSRSSVFPRCRSEAPAGRSRAARGRSDSGGPCYG